MSKQNAALNGEHGPRVRPSMKKLTAKRRRRAGKEALAEELEFWEALSQEPATE